MNLLIQAIQEYLADHHPDWETDGILYGSIYIINHKTHPGRYIRIATTIQMLSTNSYIHNNKITRKENTYTNHTLLPQITEIINKQHPHRKTTNQP